MLRTIWTRRPSPGTVLGGLALIVAMSGAAVAAIPDSSGVISACLTKDGAIKVIDAEAGDRCPKNHTLLTWNQTGPVGPTGPTGAQGSPDSAQQVLDKIKTVDGHGSGLDADAIDGRDATDFLGASDPLRCKVELLLAGLTEPADANYVVGTEGDDEFSETDGRDVICGFGGADSVGMMTSSGDIFLGGDGDDFVFDMRAGEFIGGAGDDDAITMAGTATFTGGQGNDGSWEVWSDATLNGGAGNDTVLRLEASGIFNGGDGDDTVEALYDGGTFNGEAGCDDVETLHGGTFNPGDQSTCPPTS